ncbi:MAG TPA: GNAT family N-acetyltransferase, partial [Saprospiraceae bacterium]|nr:GNAT family N-acetyltransferase [Saprospiraceae bacterium]
MIEILEVKSKKELTKFIDFPHDLYSNDPNYVPMLFMEQEALLNEKKSPFFLHSTATYYLAYKDGKIVGRIAAILNKNHISFTGRNEGFFGFFDVINDYEVAKSLLDRAELWLKEKGVTKVMGPANFSTNETVGLLVDNFETPPYIMNTYNFSYYQDILEKYGFVKQTDLLCYKMVTADMPVDIMEFGEKLEKRLAERGIIIRKLNMKHYKKEIESFLPVYNASWSENTGFVPMTDAEIKQIAKDLKAVVDPDFIYFAIKDSKVIGVSLTIPNVNEIQKNVKRGRLLPFGLFKILFGLKKIKTVRILALGTL